MGSPVDALFHVAESLEARASRMPAGSLKQATAMRDALVILILICVPLRIENIAALQVGVNADGGYLEYAEDGRYVLHAYHLKTRGRINGGELHVPLPKGLSARIDDYLRVFRPRLTGQHGGRYFFCTSRNPDQIWRKIDNMIRGATSTFLPSTGGFGPHLTRNIVCTDFLIKHPAQLEYAAQLLNITVATLTNHYLSVPDSRSHDIREDDLAPYLAKRKPLT